MNFSFSKFLLIGCLMLGSAALVIGGCGGDEPAELADPHAGHDHGPGEHVDAPDPHAGHDHGPGEHAEAPLTLVDDWCVPHRVPESECTQCNPALIDHFKETGDWCAGHDLPESHCRLCNPGIVFPQEEILRTRTAEFGDEEVRVSLFFRENAAVCATNDALIQFASAETAERAGLSVQRVRAADLATSVEAPAEVVFDETKATVVTTTVPALVSRWLVSPGESVREGEVIAIMQSPEVADLESRLLSAHADLQVHAKELARHKELFKRDLIAERELERQQALYDQANSAYIGSRGLLRSAGLSEADIDEIIEYRKISNSFALRAPSDGLVVEWLAQLGELQEAGRAFVRVADPSAMWIEARLTEEQLRQMEVGQPLTFTSDGRGLRRVGGKVIWVSRFLDPHTRTGTVRAQVVDPRHALQAGEFGRVMISREGDDQVTLVPRGSVQWEGCCNVVFVRESVDRYRPRKVEFTNGAGPYYQVLHGLEPGEEVVVDGAFLLKTELKKASIGAGCCGLDPVG